MLKTHRLLVYVFFISGILIGCAQPSESIRAAKGSFGIDKEKQLILWNADESSAQQGSSFTSLLLDSTTYSFEKKIKGLTPEESYQIKKGETTYQLFLTRFPIIHLTTQDSIKDDPKIPFEMQYYTKDSLIAAIGGIELRGNVSLKFPKKSYDLEFWEDTTSKKEKDYRLGGMREDGDWVLDGLFDEPLRLRSYVAQKLWLDTYQPFYSNQEPKAKSGVDATFTEVFLNGTYLGIHKLSEQVDRKLVRVPKIENGVARGLLYKAGAYEGATEFKKAPEFRNIFPNWGGFEMEYPFEDFTAHWDALYAATDFVVNSTDQQFGQQIGEQFELDNIIDYYLFINLLRATDNMGKNYFIARYDATTPFFIVPWDLDGVLGTIIDGRQIETTNDILSNGLYDRLWTINPNQYRQKVAARWFQLRKEGWKTEKLLKRITEVYTMFKKEHIYERETKLWEQTPPEAHLTYITNWIEDRTLFLDGYFKPYKK